ncbi:MAG TPA: hypothetical protein VKP08_21880, partial [Anaerolineales bacterium]|nr:hypothetical protein [Anaerolineales bacterium]
ADGCGQVRPHGDEVRLAERELMRRRRTQGERALERAGRGENPRDPAEGDAEFGVRPLRRVIQQKVEDPLSDRVLGGEFQDGDSVLVSLNAEGEIVLEQDGARETAEAPAV